LARSVTSYLDFLDRQDLFFAVDLAVRLNDDPLKVPLSKKRLSSAPSRLPIFSNAGLFVMLIFVLLA
jgi:hypothetical protein